jgi:hypothetical protein
MSNQNRFRCTLMNGRNTHSKPWKQSFTIRFYREYLFSENNRRHHHSINKRSIVIILQFIFINSKCISMLSIIGWIISKRYNTRFNGLIYQYILIHIDIAGTSSSAGSCRILHVIFHTFDNKMFLLR